MVCSQIKNLSYHYIFFAFQYKRPFVFRSKITFKQGVQAPANGNPGPLSLFECFREFHGTSINLPFFPMTGTDG